MEMSAQPDHEGGSDNPADAEVLRLRGRQRQLENEIASIKGARAEMDARRQKLRRSREAEEDEFTDDSSRSPSPVRKHLNSSKSPSRRVKQPQRKGKSLKTC